MTQAPHWTRTPGNKTGHAFHANGATSSSAYAEAALGAECLSVATAFKGSRNDTLNRAAFSIGQLIAGMEIDETTARRRLEGAALAAGLDPIEIASTINSGFLAGAAEPRVTPKNGKAAEPEMKIPEPDMSVISRNAKPAPPFPREVLGLAASWCEEEARSKNVPFDFVALGLLVATAGLIGPKRRASPWSGWAEPAILWGSLVGPPSIGKSPAIDSVRDAIGIIEREQNSDWRERSAEYEEARKVYEAKQSAWEGELAAAAKKGHAPPPIRDNTGPAEWARRALLKALEAEGIRLRAGIVEAQG